MRVIYPDFFSGFFSRSSNLSITISGSGFFYGHDQMVSFHFVLVFQRWFISSKGQNVLFSEGIECHFKLTTDILEYSLLNLCDPLRYNAGISSWCVFQQSFSMWQLHRMMKATAGITLLGLFFEMHGFYIIIVI